MPSVTSETASIVASTGCLIERSLRNTLSPRLHAHTFSTLAILLRDQLFAPAQPFDDFELRIALVPDAHRAAAGLPAFNHENRRALGGPVVPVNRCRRNYDRAGIHARENVALREHAGFQFSRGIRHLDAYFCRARLLVDGRVYLQHPPFERDIRIAVYFERDSLPGADRPQVGRGHRALQL